MSRRSVLLNAWALISSIGLANLVDLFNPDLIVLAGSLNSRPRVLPVPALDREVQKHAWKHSNRQMLLSQLGETRHGQQPPAAWCFSPSSIRTSSSATAELAQI